MDDENNGKDLETGRFLKNNKFWLKRTTHGPKLLMESPEKLQEACLKYFDQVVDNPLNEEKIFCSKDGKVTRVVIDNMQVMSLGGLCLYLAIDRTTWAQWRKRPDLSLVCSWVDEVISTYQLNGAVAGLLNPAIIIRMLGLADKKDLTHKLKKGSDEDDGIFEESVKNAMAKAEEMVKDE